MPERESGDFQLGLADVGVKANDGYIASIKVTVIKNMKHKKKSNLVGIVTKKKCFVIITILLFFFLSGLCKINIDFYIIFNISIAGWYIFI